jgi:hypothetical protein
MKIMKNWLIYGSYDDSHSPSKSDLVSYSIRKREWEFQRRLSGWLWGREYQVLLWRCWQVSRFAVSYVLRLCRVRFSIRNRQWLQLAPNSSCRDDCEEMGDTKKASFCWDETVDRNCLEADMISCIVYSPGWRWLLSRFLVALWAQIL